MVTLPTVATSINKGGTLDEKEKGERCRLEAWRRRVKGASSCIQLELQEKASPSPLIYSLSLF